MNESLTDQKSMVKLQYHFLIQRIKDMNKAALGKVIAVYVEKGGTGKTTLSVQIGFELAHRGKKVLIVDNEMQGSSTKALLGDELPQEITSGFSNTINLYKPGAVFKPYEAHENLFVFGSDDSLTSINSTMDTNISDKFLDSIEALAQEFDFIIIDCPPTFGMLSVSAIHAAVSGGVLIPSELEELSFDGAIKVVKRVMLMNKRVKFETPILGVVFNLVRQPLTSLAQEFKQQSLSEFGEDGCFTNSISSSARFQEALYIRRSVRDVGKNKIVMKIVNEIEAVTDELLIKLGVGDK